MSLVVLVTGGARSGKSRFAERRTRELGPPPWLYVATGEAGDEEMRARIDRHRRERDPGFRTVEAPRDPAAAIARESAASSAVLLDCVTLLLSNLLHDGGDDETILSAIDALGRAARSAPSPVVLVTNEVGQGIVPEAPIARRFRDLAGFANQRLAALADEVVLVTCGLPLRLK